MLKSSKRKSLRRRPCDADSHAKIKTDKVDALTLAQLLKADFLPKVEMPDLDTWQLRQLLYHRRFLVKQKGIVISPGGVRSIWLRHSLEKKHLRLKRLEVHSVGSGIILTESQVQALEEAKEEKKAHGEIETFHPGYLLGQDTFYVGYIKGVGRIYQQTAIDTFSNYGFAKLYLDKSGLTSADILNDRVLPLFLTNMASNCKGPSRTMA